MAKEKEKIWTRKDVERAIEEHGGTAEGLDLSGKVFEEGIILSEEYDGKGINLAGAAFNKSVLKGAVFDKCHLEEIRLMGANLEGAWFEEAHLEGANLSGAHMENTHLVSAHLEKATLNGTHFEGAEFFDAHLEEAKLINAFLDRTRLSGAHLQGAHLFGAKFSANTEMESADWGNYILAEEREGKWTLKMAGDIYRQLKVWYTEHGIYNTAGKFFYREMEAKRKALSWKKELPSKLWSWVMRLLCGYGERYGNVVVVALVIIFGLAVVYGFGGLNLAYAIYFSAVSFTALGYGSWAGTPIGWVQGVGAAESFLGVFMMALFLVTFIRKMTR